MGSCQSSPTQSLSVHKKSSATLVPLAKAVTPTSSSAESVPAIVGLPANREPIPHTIAPGASKKTPASSKDASASKEKGKLADASASSVPTENEKPLVDVIPDLHTTAGSAQDLDSSQRSGLMEESDVLVSLDGSSPGSSGVENRPRLASYASGASSVDDFEDEGYSSHSSTERGGGGSSNGGRSSNRSRSSRRALAHSASAIGLDEMIEDRREVGDLTQNVVHFEVPFGKPIEEVYDGVHSGPVLGSGISGLVRLVTHKATGLKYAVKVLDLGLVDTAEGLRQLREEIYIMCQLDHPNIVRLEEVYESTSEIYLVQELCLGGELFDRLDEQPDYHYTEAECARLVKQMLCAVRYLHSRGIIHRDLKLENFLFSSTAKDSELKMIDFGLSKHFRYGEVQREAVGTPYTVAPEVIRGCYDERCDIWAIGVISFLLLSGDPPFGGCGGPEPLMTVRSNILRGAFSFQPESVWSPVSQQARLFISALLVTDPNIRPTAREAQRHRWLQEWANRDRKGEDNVLSPNVVKALVNFKEFSDMRKLLCEVLSFTLLPDQIRELRREFEKMDTDGSGEISLNALKQVLMTNAGAGSLGALTEEEVEDIFNAMRVRKTETRIHWHEFIAAGLSQCQVDDRNLRLAFDRLDSDHKGYIILEDIMDLMGIDALQSEDAMRRMWGDSIKAVKCQHARITYDDFLLLMKGQTKDTPELEKAVEASSVKAMLEGSARLHIVQGETETDESSNHSHESLKRGLQDPAMEEEIVRNDVIAAIPMYPNPPGDSRSAPSTPADHKKIVDIDELESPLSTEPKFTHSDPSLLLQAPLLSGATDPRDFNSSLSSLPVVEEGKDVDDAIMQLPTNLVPKKPPLYTRRRSRSFDNMENETSAGEDEKDDVQDLNAVAGVVRDMLLPETDRSDSKLSSLVNDESKSALVVNRKLYRAHRQMRLAVLEASKRFEEQQAAHATEIILAQREAAGMNDSQSLVPAGLVMRHGHKKQVSSEAVQNLLLQNEQEQKELVDQATRRGGRGKRSRKKTISDMSGMLQTSLTQEELGALVSRAEAESVPPPTPPMVESKTLGAINGSLSTAPPTGTESADADDAQIRKATIPGVFLKTKDPFGKQGKYGGVPTPTWN